jgi:Rieske Fe-S protein
MQPPSPPPPERRSFLKRTCHGLGVLFGAVLGVPAIAYLIDARNRPAPDRDFKTVAQLSDLEKNVPYQAVVRDVRTDAWTLHPNDVIGRVWLIRRDDRHVDAYTTICPHLGCSINFDAASRQFICPCHGGTWDLKECKRVELKTLNNPAPRGMDQLECRVDPANPDWIQVKYQNFIQGREEKVPKA